MPVRLKLYDLRTPFSLIFLKGLLIVVIPEALEQIDSVMFGPDFDIYQP